MLDSKSMSSPNATVQRPRLVRADSQLRNKWLAAISFLIFVLALLFWGSPSVQDILVQLFSDDATEDVFRLLIIFYSLFAILAIILITIGIHLIQVAREIQQSNRFPAPGMRVMHDTWVIRGSQAQLLSYLFLGMAIVLIFGGGAIPFYFHDLLLQLLAQG